MTCDHLLDAVFGRPTLRRDTIDHCLVRTDIDGGLALDVRVVESRRERPRWPWPRRTRRVFVRPERPVVVYRGMVRATSFRVATIDEAVRDFAFMLVRRRTILGSIHHPPADGSACRT